MILEHKGKRPAIAPSARIAPNATICGEVSIGANTSIGFGAVVSAESGAVSIGANCVVMDTAVLRGVRGNPLTIGDNVLVGPRAYLTGCSIEAEVFIATGATIFNGAHIGRRAEVRINGICTCVRRCRKAPRSRSARSPSETRPRSSPRMNMSGSGRSRRRSIFLVTSSGSSGRRRANRSCRM